jgi:hypothetical protein
MERVGIKKQEEKCDRGFKGWEYRRDGDKGNLVL